MSTLYTVRKCRKDNTLFGNEHGSIDTSKTLCELVIDDNWWIVDNTSSGTITCKKCLSILNKSQYQLKEKL